MRRLAQEAQIALRRISWGKPAEEFFIRWTQINYRIKLILFIFSGVGELEVKCKYSYKECITDEFGNNTRNEIITASPTSVEPCPWNRLGTHYQCCAAQHFYIQHYRINHQSEFVMFWTRWVFALAILNGRTTVYCTDEQATPMSLFLQQNDRVVPYGFVLKSTINKLCLENTFLHQKALMGHCSKLKYRIFALVQDMQINHRGFCVSWRQILGPKSKITAIPVLIQK